MVCTSLRAAQAAPRLASWQMVPPIPPPPDARGCGANPALVPGLPQRREAALLAPHPATLPHMSTASDKASSATSTATTPKANTAATKAASSTTPAKTPIRAYSGIQPSGAPHLGNDLGAIRNYVALQEQYESIYCIVDYHALTSVHDAEKLRRQTREMAAALLALGLDPDKCTLFVQSHRPEVLELAWILMTVTPVSWVERTPTYKEKKLSQPDDVNHGLLSYPILQAADILLPKASVVPIGKDQAVHLELSREIARSFNNKFGETFPEPQAIFTSAPVVLGTDGEKKMSKSLGNAIEILAEPELITKQVMSAVTDIRRPRRSDPGHPEACNVCQLHKIVSPDYEQLWENERNATSGCVDMKRLLAERLAAHYAPARERYKELMALPHEVDAILHAGAARLLPLVTETMREVKERVGLA